MANLRVTGHYPSINQLDVPRNATVLVYFDKELRSTSIDYRVISINDDDYVSVPGVVSTAYTNGGTVSGLRNVLTFTPSTVMPPNTRYSVYVYKDADSPQAVDGSFLDKVYRFSYNTGTGVVTSSGVAYSDDAERLTILLNDAIADENWGLAQTLLNQIALVEGSGYIPPTPDPGDDPIAPELPVTEFAVTSTHPQHQQPNITDLRYIKINFNDVPATSNIDMRDFITISHENVLG